MKNTKQPLLKSILAILIAVLTALPQTILAADNQPMYEFQQAAQYTHLKWPNRVSPKISVQLNPLVNYSGIPLEEREEKPEYYYHGKLPQAMQRIYADAFRASRFFNPDLQPLPTNTTQEKANADYQITLILDDYKLPFKYAPDDSWWQALHDETDRWLQHPPTTYIKLTMKITSGSKKIKTWLKTTEMTLSNCDLNRFPQPSTAHNNRDITTRAYLSTTPGQTFLAATNYLILNAIQRLEQEAPLGRVSKRFGQEIYLTSDSFNFVEGSQLNLYYDHSQKGKSTLPAGKIKVLKAMQNQAIAYPLTLRADHITQGDWVEMGNKQSQYKPKSHFVAANQCSEVVTAQVN
ncbi:hypothetical protein [Aliikangiella sp. IMCC44359]|uniref:hypothetical protein n=1 Tax=Aliikangiella sp. IMCC44359 TaxID=3459125 RepID=UPI00403AE6C0